MDCIWSMRERECVHNWLNGVAFYRDGEDQGGGEDQGRDEDPETSVRHIQSELLIRYLNGDIGWAVEYMSLEFSGKVKQGHPWIGDI